MRLTCAFSDGRSLYAIRYATDEAAPTLYYRWSASRQGMAVVSEPLETGEEGWQRVPAGSFCRFTGDSAEIQPFAPEPLTVAA